MKEMYTINDIIQITGLSDRTIRSYISQKVLEGEKVDGAWRFSAEQLSAFLNDANVLPGIRAKKNALIYDFMIENRRREPEMCLMLDLPASDDEKVSGFFCEAINNGEYKGIQFSFDSMGGHTPRVILKGKPEDVLRLMQQFYAE